MVSRNFRDLDSGPVAIGTKPDASKELLDNLDRIADRIDVLLEERAALLKAAKRAVSELQDLIDNHDGRVPWGACPGCSDLPLYGVPPCLRCELRMAIKKAEAAS